MRRLKAVLAALAVMVMMLASAAPAMADEWWDNCHWNWNWSWYWGWFLTCDYDDGGWSPGWGHDGWGNDDDDNNGWGDPIGH